VGKTGRSFGGAADRIWPRRFYFTSFRGFPQAPEIVFLFFFGFFFFSFEKNGNVTLEKSEKSGILKGNANFM